MCLGFASSIQRKYPLEQWHVACRSVPAECREEVVQYLCIMADRTRLAEITKQRLGLS
jgi:hypothetical protein